MEKKKSEIEEHLIPALREGVNVIKMVLYKELKPFLESKYTEMDTGYVNQLTGCVVNDLFGVQNMDEPFATFFRDNENRIRDMLKHIAVKFDYLQIPLTDALRIQYLCDNHEGMNSEAILEQAKKLNILIPDREVPLPGAFMSIVRSFGLAYKILDPIKNKE
jgi:hypothetical protein